MIRRTPGPAMVGLLLLCSPCLPAAAQPVLEFEDELGFDEPESWAMKYFAALSLPTSFGAPRDLEPGSVRLELEAGWVPTLSTAQRTVGFGGQKTEDLNRTSVFGRGRVVVGLPSKLSLLLGWVPPVELDGVRPNHFSLALGRPLAEGARGRVGARLVAQHGSFEGDFTCSADEIARGDNLFDCEAPSRDEMTVQSAGLEIGAALPLGRTEKLEAHATVGFHSLDLEFAVDARYNGIIDRTNLLTEGEIWSATVGFGYRPDPRARLVVEVFYSPLDVVRPPDTAVRSDDLWNVRGLFGYEIR